MKDLRLYYVNLLLSILGTFSPTVPSQSMMASFNLLHECINYLHIKALYCCILAWFILY